MGRHALPLVLGLAVGACDASSMATRGLDSAGRRLDSLERRVERLERAAAPADSARRRTP